VSERCLLVEIRAFYTDKLLRGTIVAELSMKKA
jgi:hypothetical protein